MKTSVLFRRFLPYYSKYKKEMAFDLLCALLTTLCEVIFPQIIKLITNQAVEDYTKITTQWVLMLGGIYLLLRVIDTAANYFMQYWGHVTGTKLETDMRTDLFAHLQRLSFSYYNNTKIGQIMSRITSDLFDITEFSHHFPEEVLIAVVKIAASFIILCSTNVWLTLLIFVLLPFMLIGTSYYSKRMRKAFKESRHQLGEVNAQVEDSLLGIRVVKSFANEPMEEKKFGKGNQEFFRLKKLRYRYMSGFHTVTRFFDGLMYIVVVVVGALFLSNGDIDVGEYVAYLLYISTLLTSIRRIVEFTEQFQNGMTGIERFCEVMDAPVDIHDLPGAKDLGEVKGEV
ncbi:MAG: ABC transporter ATP-binding protein, partial [Clostridia bacterium]|nr:ABC transporter ATP-binding protein [Clostridia bacterium]